MQPIQAGQSVNRFGQAKAVRFAGEAAKVRPLFGNDADGVQVALNKSSTTEEGAEAKRGAAVEGTSKPTHDEKQGKLAFVSNIIDQEDVRVAKAILFGNVIPFLTCFMWIGGPVTGLIGVAGAYVSGRIGRQVRQNIDATKLKSHTAQIDRFADMLQDPTKLQPNQFTNQFNHVLAEFGDTRIGIKGSGQFLVTAFRKASEIFIKISKKIPILNKLIRKLTTAWTAADDIGGAAVKAAAKGGSKEAAQVLAGKLFKGFSINLRVAREDNALKAAWAGLTGWFMWTLGLAGIPLELGIKALKNKFFNKEVPPQEAASKMPSANPQNDTDSSAA